MNDNLLFELPFFPTCSRQRLLMITETEFT